jgi:hypothetical protein
LSQTLPVDNPTCPHSHVWLAPSIEAVRDQVDDDLRAWVGEARRRELSWDKIGEALGMKRQSGWERFAG